MRTLIIVIGTILVLANAGAAQTPDEGKNELTVWGGFSPWSATSNRGSGGTPNSNFGIVSLRYSRRFDTGNTINLALVADITPVVVLRTPVVGGPVGARQTAYGWGGSPLGIKGIFRPKKQIRPYLEVTAGMLFFDKPVPGPQATRFNFDEAAGAGVDIRLADRKAVTLGYKFMHISNNHLGVINPGINNHLLFVGYTFFSK